jgi:anti-sigma regulatory factor (Ser/Thr protein kinase)
MPYLECPGCRLSLYSAATHSWLAESCPVCGASLEGASKRFPAAAGARTLCREFVSTPGAVAGARHALDALYGELGDRLHRTVVLLVSELVSNSVKYSKVSTGVIELIACVVPKMVRIEVSDDGDGFEPRLRVDESAESGRGLEIVEKLADRWGRPAGLRTSVWFELDREEAPAARQAGRAWVGSTGTRDLGLAT